MHVYRRSAAGGPRGSEELLKLKTPGTQRGMSLIELLVALVIASLGLLTLVGLQAASLRYNRVTERRAVATLLADDLMERIRANTTGAQDLSHYAYVATFSSQATAPALPSPSCNIQTATCTLPQLAADDLVRWRLAVPRLLPEGAVLTKVSADPNDATRQWLDLWIAWRNPVLGASAGVDLRSVNECPTELQLVAPADDTVRCMSWRMQR